MLLGRCLVVEEHPEGGAAIFGDGALAVLRDVQALGGFDVAVRGHPVAVSDGFTGDLRTIARQHVSATLGVVVGRRSSYLSQQSLGGQSDQEAERQTAKGAAVGLLTTPVRTDDARTIAS
jgi:hypothetical protein